MILTGTTTAGGEEDLKKLKGNQVELLLDSLKETEQKG